MYYLVDRPPVVVHVDDGPSPFGGLIERPVEPADVRLAVVRPLAVGVGVVDDEPEPSSRPGGGPLQHLEIAVGIAESRDGSAADELVNTDGLAGLVVDEVELGQAHEHRSALAHFELHLDAAADDLLGRNAVDTLGPRPHELDASARDDPGLEPVRAKVVEQLQHRSKGQLRVRPVERRMPGRRNPVGNGLLELRCRHAAVGCHDELEQAVLTAFGERLHVALERGLERLLLGPFRVLCGHGLHAVDYEEELEVGRLLAPERAVVIEDRDAFIGRHEVWYCRRS